MLGRPTLRRPCRGAGIKKPIFLYTGLEVHHHPNAITPLSSLIYMADRLVFVEDGISGDRGDVPFFPPSFPPVSLPNPPPFSPIPHTSAKNRPYPYPLSSIAGLVLLLYGPLGSGWWWW